ncbi:MAG: hypothetical protein HFP81_00430 [Methylococcales symbiont of Hymedesmia sp. n. MRB-2018]|nr:MAG: hypothetical protein HFP78_02940 [Methylococcales symbiont of Hymedesmia sp. n. MRB-2018]KAF3984770.1 MAG: hypothetical protein HFP81_00430 [Methylococcales symbiont of Hymedesmia sp. n. MRB-2018]
MMKKILFVGLVVFCLSGYALEPIVSDGVARPQYSFPQNQTVTKVLSATSKRDKYELAVCSFDVNIEKNPAYYHLASPQTQILCEIGKNAISGTLSAFYNEGWHLIQVVNIDNRLTTTTQQVPYSLMYLERKK